MPRSIVSIAIRLINLNVRTKLHVMIELERVFTVLTPHTRLALSERLEIELHQTSREQLFLFEREKITLTSSMTLINRNRIESLPQARSIDWQRLVLDFYQN